METLAVGGLMPHFRATDVQGRPFVYSEAAWQRRNLVLVRLPAQRSDADADYIAALTEGAEVFDACTAVTVVTRDPIEGMPGAGAVVADRYGEIFHVERAGDIASMPTAVALLEWVDFVQRQCPECRAEAR